MNVPTKENTSVANVPTVGELVRKAELEFTFGTTSISKYVQHQIYDNICKIEAYLNSQFTVGGPKDSLGRDKPFFNIVISAANIWERSTSIQRKNIKIKATKQSDTIDAFLASVHVRDWMTKENFGAYLKNWGRTLARYGSAITKFVKNNSGLHINVVPWNRIIVDSVDFDSNLKIEILELNESQLRQKTEYDQDKVEEMIEAKRVRETTDKKKKDRKDYFYKLYEVHGNLSRALYKTIKGQKVTPEDHKIFFDQIHVYSYLGGSNKKSEIQDYILYSGKEDSPYEIAHLIPEDGRTLAIGAVEHLFEAQWMQNDIIKKIRDQLDLASKLIFQTADQNYIGRNVLTSVENGQIMITAPNMPLTPINNTAHDVGGLQSFSQQWKTVGGEITGISMAMMGATSHSSNSWRMTQALLQESHNLFDYMTENKGLYLEQYFRKRIIPYIKTKMDTTEEVAATLEANDINYIDSIYVPKEAIRRHNNKFKNAVLAGKQPEPFDQQNAEAEVRGELGQLGNQRFFKPSDIKTTTWKKKFKDLEWEVEVDITGEETDSKEALQTLNTALQMVVQPGFAQNAEAQAIVGKILALTGGMSPLEYSSIMNKTNATPQPTSNNPVQPTPPSPTQPLQLPTGAVK